MKQIFVILSTLGVAVGIVGCKPSTSDSGSSTAELTNPTPPIAATRAAANDTLPVTSTDSNSPSRIYSQNTNSLVSKDADNTGKNVRDLGTNSVTAGDQPENEADRKLTQAVRKSVMANDSLSTMAKNVKIITMNGKVTLRGPVKSEQEKFAINSAAQGVTGVAGVDDQLEIKPSNP